MVITEAPSADLVWYVARLMREDDYAEISAVTWSDGRDQLAEHLAEALADKVTTVAFGKTLMEPIAIINWTPVNPSLWCMSMFATDAFPTIGGGVTRFVAHDIVPALSRAGARRVFAQSHVEHRIAHRWMEFLGMTRVHELPQLGKNGEDFAEFAYVRPHGLESFRWLGPGRIG